MSIPDSASCNPWTFAQLQWHGTISLLHPSDTRLQRSQSTRRLPPLPWPKWREIRRVLLVEELLRQLSQRGWASPGLLWPVRGTAHGELAQGAHNATTRMVGKWRRVPKCTQDVKNYCRNYPKETEVSQTFVDHCEAKHMESLPREQIIRRHKRWANDAECQNVLRMWKPSSWWSNLIKWARESKFTSEWMKDWVPLLLPLCCAVISKINEKPSYKWETKCMFLHYDTTASISKCWGYKQISPFVHCV